MIGDPATAPERADLTFLRRRSRPRAAAPAAKPATARSSAAGQSGSGSSPAGHIDYRRPDRSRPASAPPAAAAAAAASSNSLDLSGPSTSAPSSGGGIDYSHRPNAQPRATPTAPAASSGSGVLDLSDPAPTPSRPSPPAPSSGGALDLSDRPEPATPAQAPTRRAPAESVRSDRHIVRVSGRTQRLMSVQDPTVTLTRAQSGIGQLAIEAVCSPEVGDLRLGAVYQLRSGGSGAVQHADGSRFAPSSRRPVIAGSREEYERIGIDLRQITDIDRIGVYAYSESRVELTWGGTLVATLFGGSRLELPLETLYAGRVAMLMSFYNMDGQLVVRAEMETIAGDVRETARAYGYDRITWRDERSPVD